MRKELEISQAYSQGVNHHSLFIATSLKDNLSHEYEVYHSQAQLQLISDIWSQDQITESALKKFVNDSEYNPEALQFDKLTAADRISQIAAELTPQSPLASEASYFFVAVLLST